MPLSIECDAKRHEVRISGRRADVGLSVQEFTLLDALCSRNGDVCARDELGAAIWGAGNFEYNMLHRLVHRTKRKLTPFATDSIVAIAGIGYKIEITEDAALDAHPEVALTSFDDTRFVGRHDELRQLTSMLDAAIGGAGALVMLAGEPGIGKTRIAEELCTQARARGARTLSGRCYEGDASIPYAPFVEALRQYARPATDEVLRAALGRDAPEVAMLLPELRARFDDIAQPPPRTSDVERLHLFESITEVLRRIAAGAPLVLVLDDLHWADKPTLLLLQYAAHNLDAAPVMFLGAYRDVEVDRVHPLAEALDALRRDPRFRRVHLRGLPEHEMAGFLPSNDGAPPDGLTAALSAGTEGNPFFAREVVRHLIEEGSLRNEDGRWTCARANSADLGIPEGVRDVIGRRLSRLSDDCNRMLAAASATTDGIAWDVLHAVVGDDDERLLDTLDEALDAHILREEGDGRTAKYDFTHALIRQTLYSEMSTPRRILLHRTIGEAMEQVYASDIDAHVTELAQHFYAAAPGGDVERAIDYARRSADRATSLFAWEEAAQQYERALEALEIMPVQDETQKCELFLLLVKAQLQTSEIAYDDKLTANAITAADIARSMGLPRQFAEAALAHDEAAGPAGVRVERPGRLLAEALEMQPDHDTAIRAMLIASLARHSLVRWEKTEALDLSSQALAMARRLNDLSALQDVLRKCHSVLAGPAHAEERLAIAREMRSISRSVEPGSEVRWTVMLQDLMELGEMAAAESELLDLEDDRDAFKSQSVAWVVEVARATIALARGCFEEAERLMQRAVQFSQGVEGDEPGLFFALQLFTLRLHQGRVDELGPLVENLMRQSPSPSLVLLLRCAQALVYSQTQREDEACVILHELSGDDLTFASLHEGELWMISMFLLTEVCWVIGDATRAHAIYERVLPYAERPVTVLGFGTTAGSVSRLLGQLATVTECWDDAERHFEDAVEFDTRLDTPPWLANTQYNYASMLLARRGPGDAARARTLLAAALKITQELGMIALQRKIKAAQA